VAQTDHELNRFCVRVLAAKHDHRRRLTHVHMPDAVRLSASAQEKSAKISGRIRAGANYSNMDVESDQSESPNPVSEADFVRLFARHELALRNYARLILPDWSGVDDVLQDASITMWESRQRLRDESGFLP